MGVHAVTEAPPRSAHPESSLGEPDVSIHKETGERPARCPTGWRGRSADGSFELTPKDIMLMETRRAETMAKRFAYKVVEIESKSTRADSPRI